MMVSCASRKLMTPAHLENCKMKGRYVDRLSRKARDFSTMDFGTLLYYAGDVVDLLILLPC